MCIFHCRYFQLNCLELYAGPGSRLEQFVETICILSRKLSIWNEENIGNFWSNKVKFDEAYIGIDKTVEELNFGIKVRWDLKSDISQ